RVVQVYSVPVPVEAERTRCPAPRREEPADGHAEAEADSVADIETRPWREEHDYRIVVGDHNIAWIHGHDRVVGSAAHHDLAIGPQVAVALRDGSLPLYRVHHVLWLGQERVS